MEIPIHLMPELFCEDCGEPATRETADGVWLCDGDYEALCDRHFADTYDEHAPAQGDVGDYQLKESKP